MCKSLRLTASWPSSNPPLGILYRIVRSAYIYSINTELLTCTGYTAGKIGISKIASSLGKTRFKIPTPRATKRQAVRQHTRSRLPACSWCAPTSEFHTSNLQTFLGIQKNRCQPLIGTGAQILSAPVISWPLPNLQFSSQI